MVQADTLDNIADGRVDFLKIDVEGAEALVFAGAKRIMTKDRPVIAIELSTRNIEMAGHTVYDYQDYFKTLGYILVGRYRGDSIMVPVELKHFRWVMP